MKENNVPSYNLQHAQQILTRLIPVVLKQPQGSIPSEDGQSYLRLSRQNLPAIEAQPQTTPVPPSVEADRQEELIPPPLFSTWENCISWCMEVTRSEAAFVVDSQGFIIASRGRIPGWGIECTGAEMVCAVESLERIDPDAGKLIWVDLDFDRRRIVGFVAPTENEEYFVVGLLAPDPAYSCHKQVITRQIIESLPSID